MRRRVVFLKEDIIDVDGEVLYKADTPYVVDGHDGKSIENEEGLQISLYQINVDFQLVHRNEKDYNYGNYNGVRLYSNNVIVEAVEKKLGKK